MDQQPPAFQWSTVPQPLMDVVHVGLVCRHIETGFISGPALLVLAVHQQHAGWREIGARRIGLQFTDAGIAGERFLQSLHPQESVTQCVVRVCVIRRQFRSATKQVQPLPRMAEFQDDMPQVLQAGNVVRRQHQGVAQHHRRFLVPAQLFQRCPKVGQAAQVVRIEIDTALERLQCALHIVLVKQAVAQFEPRDRPIWSGFDR